MSSSFPVTTATRSVDLTASAGQTVFTFPFPVWASADLAVWVKPSGQTAFTRLTSGFTVTPSGGVVFPAQQALVTFAAGRTLNDVIRLRGQRTPDRTTSLAADGASFRPSLEAEFDEMTMVLQELRRDIDLTPFSAGDPWNAQNNRIINVAAPASTSDAARLADVQAQAAAAGNVPLPILAQVGYFLKATATGAFGWVAQTLGALAAKNTVAAADIDAGAVSYAKIQNVTSGRVLGRTDGVAAGSVQELPIAVNASGDVTLTGSIGIPAGKTFSLDAQSYLVLSGSQPILAFDLNDYITYDRANNVFNLIIGGSSKLQVNSTGPIGDGRQLTNLNTFAAAYQGNASNNPVTWDRSVFDPSNCVTRTDANTTLTTNISGRWLIETFLVRNLAGTGGAGISSYIYINGANVSQTDSAADNYGYSSLANAYVSGTLGAGTKISAGAAGAGNGGTSNIILRYLGP